MSIHNKPRGIVLLSLLALLLTGCQYQFGHGELSQSYQTVSIPYIEGDRDGGLTAEVIRQVASSGVFRYLSSGGDLKLEAKVVEIRDENIGYRYYRKVDGELKNEIVPSESRIHADVEITLMTASSKKIVKGPVRLHVSVDFDHDFYSSRNEVNVYSLGQLNDIDAAQDAVMDPLNRAIAARIVDYLVNSW